MECSSVYYVDINSNLFRLDSKYHVGKIGTATIFFMRQWPLAANL